MNFLVSTERKAWIFLGQIDYLKSFLALEYWCHHFFTVYFFSFFIILSALLNEIETMELNKMHKNLKKVHILL